MQHSHMEEPPEGFLKTLWTWIMYLDAVRLIKDQKNELQIKAHFVTVTFWRLWKISQHSS